MLDLTRPTMDFVSMAQGCGVRHPATTAGEFIGVQAALAKGPM